MELGLPGSIRAPACRLPETKIILDDPLVCCFWASAAYGKHGPALSTNAHKSLASSGCKFLRVPSICLFGYLTNACPLSHPAFPKLARPPPQGKPDPIEVIVMISKSRARPPGLTMSSFDCEHSNLSQGDKHHLAAGQVRYVVCSCLQAELSDQD